MTVILYFLENPNIGLRMPPHKSRVGKERIVSFYDKLNVNNCLAQAVFFVASKTLERIKLIRGAICTPASEYMGEMTIAALAVCYRSLLVFLLSFPVSG